MNLPLLSGFSQTLQIITIATIIFAACFFISQSNYRMQFAMAKLPAIEQPANREKKRHSYLHAAKGLYAKGYKQFATSAYRIGTADGVDTVIVPSKFLPELRKLPDDVLSFPRAVYESMEAKYTGLLTDEPLMAHSIKSDLTPALVRLNPVICIEVDEALKAELPPCKEWTGIYIYMSLVSVVAKVSGRVFVGPDICQNPEYLDASVHYTMELVNAHEAIKLMQPWLRPFLANRLPQVQALRMRERQAQAFLHPVVEARLEAQKNPDHKRPDDMLQWLMNRNEERKLTRIRLARLLLAITFAAIHTTSLTVTNVLYTLAASPEYIQPLRNEIKEAMADNDGIITSRALQAMKKLDSFMKETLRFHALGFSSFSRKVLQGITLSNGQYIPAGVCIEIPSHEIYQDNANFPEAEKFDGFRFSKIREAVGATDSERNHNQFVTSNEKNLFFGYGQHACPGRFFAANEIKMILARIILEYDIKNVDGQVGRIPNFEQGKVSSPDPTKQLMFRKVQI